MQMLPDSPSDYYKEDECTKFLVNIPVEWDQTIPLDCKIEEYVSVARRYNNQWYVAAITNFNRRSMTIDLSFLDSEKFYKVELFRDGANADKIAKDYVHESKIVQGGTILNVDLAPGGAWLAKIVEAQK